jgi:hypothetical protein
MNLNFVAIQKNNKIENNITSSEYDLFVGNENVGLGILQTNILYSQNSIGGISTVNNQWILNLKYNKSNLNMGFYYVNINQSITPSKDPVISKVMVTYITGKDAKNISMDNFFGSIKTNDNINYEINIMDMSMMK